MSHPALTLSPKPLLRSLYREVLRGLNRAKKSEICIPPNRSDLPQAVLLELKKASVNPQLYTSHLCSEIRFRAKESLEKRNRGTDQSLHLRLVVGDELVKALSAVNQNPLSTEDWTRVVQILVEHRAEEAKHNKWKEEFQENEGIIKQALYKTLHATELRRKKHNDAFSRATKKKPFARLTNSEKYKRLKTLLEELREQSHQITIQYLKALQKRGRIANPYKLPYVAESFTKQAHNLPLSLAVIPNSTSHRALKEAYDLDYINAIIKPEAEYLINEKHYLDKISIRINQKGPRVAQIDYTNAGAMKAYFLMHDKHHRMQRLAMDIKRLMRSIRKHFVWFYEKGLGLKLAETAIGDGYSVRGSMGYGPSEVMYPREYYTKLACEEAEWEALIADREKNGDYDHRANLASWQSALQVASDAVTNEVKQFYQKYEITADDPIFKRRRRKQLLLDHAFKTKTKYYAALLQRLQRDRVTMHSEMFNLNNSVTSNYETQLAEDDERPAKREKGISEHERTGLGMKLGDYLAQYCKTGFKMGTRFGKKIEIVP